MKNQSSHVDFYSKEKYYDIAFSFKNVSEENETILDAFRRHNGRDVTSFLDIGAGPAIGEHERGFINGYFF